LPFRKLHSAFVETLFLRGFYFFFFRPFIESLHLLAVRINPGPVPFVIPFSPTSPLVGLFFPFFFPRKSSEEVSILVRSAFRTLMRIADLFLFFSPARTPFSKGNFRNTAPTDHSLSLCTGITFRVRACMMSFFFSLLFSLGVA